jgi:CheY-like chemotaxis protein
MKPPRRELRVWTNSQNCKILVNAVGLRWACGGLAVAQTANRSLMTKTQENPRLLVVDDDRKLAGLIRDYLTPMGYAVELRHKGPDGLAEALAGDYESVILDVMMPGMDGFAVLRELRKKSEVPVLMLTSLGEEADRIVGLEIGADD